MMIERDTDDIRNVKPVNGKWKEFNKHGTLVCEGYFKNGQQHGRWFEYYDSGELAIIQHYEKGQPHGHYTSYHLNGKVWSEGFHENGRCHGTFNVYNESGVLSRVMVFKEGFLLEDKEVGKKDEAVIE